MVVRTLDRKYHRTKSLGDRILIEVRDEFSVDATGTNPSISSVDGIGSGESD